MKIFAVKRLRLWNALYPLIALGLVFALWQITAVCVDSELLMPSVAQTFRALGTLLGQRSFYVALGGTMGRTLAAFAISFVGGAALAAAAACVRPIRRLLSPLVLMARTVPTMSIILLALVWLSADLVPLLVVVLIVFPLLYAQILHEIESVPPELPQMARVYGVRKSRVVTRLYLPEMTEGLLAAVQSSLSLSVKLIIAAEVLAQTARSMGQEMQLSKLYLDTPALIAWTLAAIVLGGVLEASVAAGRYAWRKRK